MISVKKEGGGLKTQTGKRTPCSPEAGGPRVSPLGWAEGPQMGASAVSEGKRWHLLRPQGRIRGLWGW